LRKCTLKAQDGKNIGIDGSRVLVHTLAQHDLIDEDSLLVYPPVLGSGKKLFAVGCGSTCACSSREHSLLGLC
jgi:dihydrofolate reductase